MIRKGGREKEDRDNEMRSSEAIECEQQKINSDRGNGRN